jgi:hypothetical protein
MVFETGARLISTPTRTFTRRSFSFEDRMDGFCPARGAIAWRARKTITRTSFRATLRKKAGGELMYD